MKEESSSQEEHKSEEIKNEEENKNDGRKIDPVSLSDVSFSFDNNGSSNPSPRIVSEHKNEVANPNEPVETKVSDIPLIIHQVPNEREKKDKIPSLSAKGGRISNENLILDSSEKLAKPTGKRRRLNSFNPIPKLVI